MDSQRRSGAGGVVDRVSSSRSAADYSGAACEEPVVALGDFTLLEDLGRGAATQVFRVRRTDSNGSGAGSEGAGSEYAVATEHS